MKHLAKLFKSNKTIKILDLHNCAIGLKSSAFDASNPYENHLTTNGVEILFDSLKYNSTLRHLYLDANALDEKSIKIIADYFKFKKQIKEKGITSLWIDMNKIGDDGIKTLCDELKDYFYLKRLTIGSTMMSEIGMKYVSEVDDLIGKPLYDFSRSYSFLTNSKLFLHVTHLFFVFIDS